MTSDPLTVNIGNLYILELRGCAQGAPEQETVFAEVDDDAIELARLRLLLTSDYLIVTVRLDSRFVATLARDGPSRAPYTIGSA